MSLPICPTARRKSTQPVRRDLLFPLGFRPGERPQPENSPLFSPVQRKSAGVFRSPQSDLIFSRKYGHSTQAELQIEPVRLAANASLRVLDESGQLLRLGVTA